MVLVDTSIWSLALRRRAEHLHAEETQLVEEWARLVRSGHATLIGPIRQEILSGIREESTYGQLKSLLDTFRYLEITPGDYDQAAEFFNACRRRGVIGTHVDMLICSVAVRHDMPVYTTDSDFERYAKHVPLELHAAT